MSFKNNYLNYTLTSLLEAEPFTLPEYFYVRKILERIITSDNIIKTIFLVGKTEGLEQLFKYLIYISDKIDKSHVSIFNFKDNFDYDILNLRKICGGIKTASKVPERESDTSKLEEEVPDRIESAEETVFSESIEEHNESKIRVDIEEKVPEEILEQGHEESEKELPANEQIEEDSSLTLLENTEDASEDKEVFELSEISESIDYIEDIPEEAYEETNTVDEQVGELDESAPDVTDTELTEGTSLDEILIEKDELEQGLETAALQDERSIEQERLQPDSTKASEPHKEVSAVPDVPMEISSFSESETQSREEAVANEVYYKFENRFFEDIKILEKLFNYIDRDIKSRKSVKLSEGSLQRYTEIIEISSELANLTRQLAFDLIADIFLTINLFFTKAIRKPLLVTPLRIKLLCSSLELVNSLIKGENYLNYDKVVKEIEQLKQDLAEKAEPKKSVSMILPGKKEPEVQKETVVEAEVPNIPPDKDCNVISEPMESVEELDISVQDETIIFKLKYLVKQFERSFLSINEITGEYRKYDALEKIDELNNSLRMIAKISSSAKFFDTLKLSEVSYVFLKYLKDYRMDLQDAEIQQILKYIIFTFKMLLTQRKPEDFNVLVQYLNNPVKIFTNI